MINTVLTESFTPDSLSDPAIADARQRALDRLPVEGVVTPEIASKAVDAALASQVPDLIATGQPYHAASQIAFGDSSVEVADIF